MGIIKKTIFCLQKGIKMEFPYWKSIENLFLTRDIQFEGLLEVKNGFSNNWKYFVRADGPGIMRLSAKNGLFNHGQNFCPGQF